jgi:YebC/PmpR family DNA-binding regulatory protein
MSGHSKWATIKHQKGAKDKARGKQFAKLIRQVEVAAREGGGDADANPTLRTMFQKARDASVPLDTIERAVKRGTGELEGVRYEPITYEGYANAGVALLIETLSDNRNRTGAEVKSILTKAGGSMAEPGAVSWQFERKGIITVASSVSEDDLMLVAIDAGAEDVTQESTNWEIRCDPSDLDDIKKAIEGAGIEIQSNEAMMISSNLVPLTDEGDARKVLGLIESLEDHDDVQNVWSNFDIADEMFEGLANS